MSEERVFGILERRMMRQVHLHSQQRFWLGRLLCYLAVALSTSLLAPPFASAKDPIDPVNTENGLALKGYDPVAYFTDGAPTEGKGIYTTVWQGATYRFASAEHQEQFVAEPEKYLPQYGGYCAYAMAINSIADITPKRWAIVDGKLYLNNNFFAQTLWSADKAGNIKKADKNWAAWPKKNVG